jgi:hypothetical protein
MVLDIAQLTARSLERVNPSAKTDETAMR